LTVCNRIGNFWFFERSYIPDVLPFYSCINPGFKWNGTALPKWSICIRHLFERYIAAPVFGVLNHQLHCEANMDMQDRTLPFFLSPADQVTRDLANQPKCLAQFAALWNDYLDGFAQQAIVGNPWQLTNSSNTPYYYNPLTTAIPATAAATAIQWSAMPGRIAYYNEADWNSQLSQAQINQLAEFGWQPGPSAAGSQTFPQIDKDPCSGQSDPKPYGPYGPQGWLGRGAVLAPPPRRRAAAALTASFGAPIPSPEADFAGLRQDRFQGRGAAGVPAVGSAAPVRRLPEYLALRVPPPPPVVGLAPAPGRYVLMP
jgi:hypothetical protein